jgi:capsid assembly protease
MHRDQSGFDEQMGFVYTYVYAGDRKVDGNPHAPLSDAAQASLQGEVSRLYGMFVELVANHRGMDAADVRGTQAAVLNGPDAIAAGLADQLGTLSEAIAALGDFASDIGRTTFMDQAPQPSAESENPEPVLTAEALNEVQGTVAEALEHAAELPAATVVQFDQVRQAAASVRREAGEIIELCKTAKMPELAGEYIAKATPLNAVRADLQRRQAERSEATAIETIHTPAPAAVDRAPSELTKVLADRWSRQMGRSQ